jgi:diacylglycerol kinase (ATP)
MLCQPARSSKDHMTTTLSVSVHDAGRLGPGTRATVIGNPVSGTHDVRSALPAAINVLRQYGWQVNLQFTAHAGDVRRLAVQARDQHQDVVIVAGGDGSLNEAANALALSEVALGVLPSGTANVWARQIGLPIPLPLYTTQLADAARALGEASVRPIDLGRIDSHYFVLWSGIGLDAHVAAQIEPRPAWVKRFGVVGYAWRAFWIATKFRGRRMAIDVDGRQIKCRALMVLVSNAQLYGGIVRAAPHAQLDDGWLDIAIFKGSSFREAAQHTLQFLWGRGPTDRAVITLRGRHIRVEARRPCFVHVDAEPIGQTPIEIDVVPQALRVLVPRNAPPDLFMSQD